MKMYILIKDSIPLGFALVAAAHASLAAYLKFKDAPEMLEWISGPFKKVVCKVNDDEFEQAKKLDDIDKVVLTESALENKEVAIAFKPRAEWPDIFKKYQLYK